MFDNWIFSDVRRLDDFNRQRTQSEDPFTLADLPGLIGIDECLAMWARREDVRHRHKWATTPQG